jgi:pullulanase/glycogen debranching enzyme
MLLAAEMPVGFKAAPGKGKTSALLIVFNAERSAVEFRLPAKGQRWHCLITTADFEPSIRKKGIATIEARSVQLFELQI